MIIFALLFKNPLTSEYVRLVVYTSHLLKSLLLTNSHNGNKEKSQRNENDPPPPPKPRRRTQRITARRQRELLYVFEFQELEWAELDEVDTEGLAIPDVSSVESRTPVIEDPEPCWS